jgi:general secretion pathway protein G
MKSTKPAFSMIELVFVIVIIGILASVAIPRLAVTRDDAEISKARVTVASVRNALGMERQKRILRGDFTTIVAVGGTNTGVFGNFDDDSSKPMVLEYAMPSSTNKGKWSVSGTGATTEYKFNSSAAGNPIFVVTDGKFICKENVDCSSLLD